MALQPLDYLNGTLSIIIVIIAFYVGFHIISKFFEQKNRDFLLVGLVAILTSSPWFPHSISFFLALITGKGLDPVPYFILGNVFIPIAIVFWLIAFTDLLYEEKKKVVLSIGVFYLIIYEILLFSLLLYDATLIGERIGAIDVQYGLVLMALLIGALMIILPTGLLFAKESLKSENPEIKMKAIFLAVAFISFCAGAAIDAIILSNVISLLFARILLVISAIGFLGGFIPPDWMKRTFLKEFDK